jgi:hypothetical protein
MSKPTNADVFIEAYARAEARKAAEEALPEQNRAFLKALQQRWFPLGKTEDYEIVKKLLIAAWSET